KLAPSGIGESGYIVASGTIPYTIRFENKPDATAPARLVTISDVLDEDLDLTTFQFTEITFAGHTIAMPAGLDQYRTQVSLTVGAQLATIVVDGDARVNHETRELTLTVQAFDPLTGWFSEDPLVGLL